MQALLTPGAPAGATPPAPSRIAVIEDDDCVRIALVRALEARSYVVTAFDRCQPALILLAASPPDLMIVDVRLPDGCGLDLLNALRSAAGARVPSIVISGRGEEEDILRGFDAGAADYMTKPFTVAELLARVTVHLRAPPDRSVLVERIDPALVPLVGGLAFGRYTMIRELGRGGYGVVFLARDAKGEGDGLVALKVAAALEDDGLVGARFIRESYALAAVRDGHVVQILAGGTVNGRQFYAMEYVEGESVLERVRRAGPIGEADARGLAGGLLQALAAVERAGVVHRDLKPSNVILRGGDLSRPVLVDFGLARLGVDAGITDPDMLMGTISYLAPELISIGRADHRSDLYGLGLTLRFALEGQELFSHLDGPELLEAIVAGPIPPIAAPLSAELRALLMDLLERDPALRPDGAEAALERLRALPPIP